MLLRDPGIPIWELLLLGPADAPDGRLHIGRQRWKDSRIKGYRLAFLSSLLAKRRCGVPANSRHDVANLPQYQVFSILGKGDDLVILILAS